jgi:hypothetical protein
MQRGKRSAQWDHTAALITHIRLAAGDKKAKPQAYHPYVDPPDDRAKFKQLVREGKVDESNDL